MTSSGTLLRNATLNFFGQIVPLVFSLAAIPLVVRGLGVAAFGVLTLSWAVQNYFAFFDFGLARATTRAVAMTAAAGNSARMSTLVATSLALQTGLGVLGGLVLAAVTPVLVKVLEASPAVLAEMRTAFLLMSFSVPFLILSGALRGVLEGLQRFDLVNAVRVPSGVLATAAPVVGVFLGWGIFGIIALQVLTTTATCVAYGFLVVRSVPGIHHVVGAVHWRKSRELASYGGWIMLATALSPMLTYADRFLIGAARSVSEVAFYGAAYAITSKLWIIASSMFMTTFPVFSVAGKDTGVTLEALLGRVFKYMFLAVGFAVLLIILSAEGILDLWLGAEFAAQSTLSLQILAVGFLLNSLSWVPSTLLQGVGRPDVVSKLLLAEVIPYLALAWVLIRGWGISGAALAWAVRGASELILLLAAARKVTKVRTTVLAENGTFAGGVAFWVLALVGLYTEARLEQTGLPQTATTAVLVAAFLVCGWMFVLDKTEKREINSALARLTRKIRPSF